MTEVIFRPAAEQELREAHDWYEARAPALGFEFMRRIAACLATIRQHSEIYPVVYRGVRQGVLKRFPYSLLYLTAENRVIVLAVFHSSRDPSLWKRRL